MNSQFGALPAHRGHHRLHRWWIHTDSATSMPGAPRHLCLTHWAGRSGFRMLDSVISPFLRAGPFIRKSLFPRQTAREVDNGGGEQAPEHARAAIRCQNGVYRQRHTTRITLDGLCCRKIKTVAVACTAGVLPWRRSHLAQSPHHPKTHQTDTTAASSMPYIDRRGEWCGACALLHGA